MTMKKPSSAAKRAPRRRYPFMSVSLPLLTRPPAAGGPLGTALTQALFDRTWIARIERTRAVKVTAAGREALAQAGLAEVLTHLDETASNDAAG
ncbi:hypothetical protein [Actinomyces oris]|uniref:hypothetical protein n=1 Tax=Actinomyces oris TaxID=544580 RepID=UPI0021167C1F|nr:hypothetical protein [Actinomyces oris]